MKKRDPQHFADYNNISEACDKLGNLLKVYLFTFYGMVVNRDKLGNQELLHIIR